MLRKERGPRSPFRMTLAHLDHCVYTEEAEARAGKWRLGARELELKAPCWGRGHYENVLLDSYQEAIHILIITILVMC